MCSAAGKLSWVQLCLYQSPLDGTSVLFVLGFFLNFEAFANNFPIRSLIFILCTVFFFCCTPAHFWSGVLAFQKQYHAGEQELTQMVVMSPGALTTSSQLYCFTIKTR